MYLWSGYMVRYHNYYITCHQNYCSSFFISNWIFWLIHSSHSFHNFLTPFNNKATHIDRLKRAGIMEYEWLLYLGIKVLILAANFTTLFHRRKHCYDMYILGRGESWGVQITCLQCVQYVHVSFLPKFVRTSWNLWNYTWSDTEWWLNVTLGALFQVPMATSNYVLPYSTLKVDKLKLIGSHRTYLYLNH